VDTRLAIASKRDERNYGDRPISDEVVERILDAGRLSGSAGNRQRWRYIIVASPERKDALADAVYAGQNVRTATLVVAIVGRGFDLGRSAQNMMLAAWNEGVLSCPNGIPDQGAAQRVLGLGGEEEVGIVLSFGYPTGPRNPDAHPPEWWSERANRKPLSELVTRI
jgi:nitroreductase